MWWILEIIVVVKSILNWNNYL